MNFIEQFNFIINNQKVNENIRFILDEGDKHSLFINYFGVNYNKEKLVSVKLYFSFFKNPSNSFLNTFEINDIYKNLIFNNWKPSKTYNFIHQGLTFGLKCYLNNGKVIINKYVHFRTSNFALGLPSKLNLFDEDKINPGICLEFHNSYIEEKKYFYINSIENKLKLLKDFGIENKATIKNLNIIEYTESELERKINLGLNNTDSVKKILTIENNQRLKELSFYFYNKFNLYFFAPGYRINNTTKAIYYVPREVYYENFPMQTINLLIK